MRSPGLPPLSTGDSAGSTATTLTEDFCKTQADEVMER